MADNVREMWSEDQLDQALAALHNEVPPGDQALANARADLMAAAGQPQQEAPKRHWGRWVAASAIIAMLVAAALVAQTVSFGGKPAVSSAAAQVLNSAADKIGASDPVVKPGQYLYIETRGWTMNSANADGKELTWLEGGLTRQWVPADRTQEWLERREKTGERQWIHGSDAELEAMGMPEPEIPSELKARCGDFFPEPGKQPCQKPGGWSHPTPEFLASLPSEPHALLDLMRAESYSTGSDPDLRAMRLAAGVIRTGLVPAKIRATFYRALALMPALEISEQDANLDGRKGIALGVDRAGQQDEIIIDPATGQFIGQRGSFTERGPQFPADTVSSYSSMTTAVVDKLGDVPSK